MQFNSDHFTALINQTQTKTNQFFQLKGTKKRKYLRLNVKEIDVLG